MANRIGLLSVRLFIIIVIIIIIVIFVIFLIVIICYHRHRQCLPIGRIVTDRCAVAETGFLLAIITVIVIIVVTIIVIIMIVNVINDDSS